MTLLRSMHPRNPQRGRWLLTCFVLAIALCLVMIAIEAPRHHEPGSWLRLYRLTTPVEQQWPSLRLMADDADD